MGRSHRSRAVALTLWLQRHMYVTGFCFLMLCVLGIIFAAIGGKNLKKVELEKEQVGYGIAVDALPTQTVVNIFSYQHTHKFVTLEQSILCEDIGLSNYKRDQLQILSSRLIECFRDASSELPSNASVPVFFGATSGMRLIRLSDESLHDELLNVVRKSLKTTQFNVKWVKTIDGAKEAEYKWIAANLAINTLSSDEQLGILSMDGNDAQIAFEVPQQDSHKESVSMFTIDEKNFTVYGHSYMCAGREEFHRRRLAMLIQDSGYASELIDPCYLLNEHAIISSEIWRSPCSSGNYARDTLGGSFSGPANRTFKITGSGNATACLASFKNVFNMACAQFSCGFFGTYQPPLSGSFQALASMLSVAEEIDSGDYESMIGFWAKVETFCNTGKSAKFRTSAKMSEMFVCIEAQYLIHLKITVSEIFLKEMFESKILDEKGQSGSSVTCLDAVYTFFALTQGFNFIRDDWKINFSNMNEEMHSWTYGMIYSKKDELYMIENTIKQTIKRNGYRALIAFGIILLVVGVIGVVFVVLAYLQRGDYNPFIDPLGS